MTTHNILHDFEVLDESGKIIPQFAPRDGSGWVPHGRYTVLGEDGRPLLEITYCHGVPQGPFHDFWPNGKVACEGQYYEGKQEGIWHFYNMDGSLMEIIHFKDGKEINLGLS
jgi:antitoxin component YwqK of YwqJK toxin-antitoxin module